MKLSEVCINRPVFAWVLTLIMILLGVVTGDRLPVRQYPKFTENYITIKKTYPGAGPEIIENQVTRIIEEAVSGIEGIETIESKSDSETSEVVIKVAEGRDLEVVTNDIRDRLDKREDSFPREAQAATLTKAGSGEKSIMNLALISQKLTDSALYAYASNEVSHTLEAVNGVARIDVYGAGDYQMTISLDPQRMAFYDLTVLEVISALSRQNVEAPAGKIINKDKEYVVTTVADLQSAEEFDNIPIVNKKKNIVKLKDIGKAKLDKSNKKVLSRFNGEKVVTLSVIAQSSANPIQVARGIKAKYEEVQKQLPPDVRLCVAYDSTIFIERSLNEVYRTIFEAILLVVLVVFVFLRSLRAALIPLITVPISLIGSMFIMYLCGFTINSMTLMSMVLAIGLVVDDAIVILENIYKYIEKGFNPVKAAIEGTKEVSFAVIAMTLTLCAVYAPVALAKGSIGMYLKEFSITLAGAVLLSGFIALTLSPMMCSRTLIEKNKPASTNKIAIIIKNFISKFDASGLIARTEERYSEVLKMVLNKRKPAVIFAIAFSIFGYFIYAFMPAEQVPYQDKHLFGYDGHAPQTATMQYTQRYVDSIDKIIGEIPEVESRSYNITNPTFEGVVLLQDHGRSTDDILAEVEKKCNAVAGVDVKFSSGRGGGSDDSSKLVSFVVRGNKSHRELREISSNLIREIHASGIVQSVRASSKNEAEDYIIEILRDKASSLNIEPQAIADTIKGLMQGTKAKTFKKDSKIYDVKVEIEEKSKRSPDQLNDIYVKTHTDRNEELLVPLAELINVYARSGPVSINRYNRTRSSTVVALLNNDTSLKEGIDIVWALAKKTLPEDVFVEFIGETKKYMTESNVMLLIFMLALSFIYLVMAAQFESWSDPFIIMLTVPLALVGGIITLACLKTGTINIFSNIGFLTLVGLITKHGILIVDFANKLVAEGKPHKEAVHEAAVRRLRPILMTTFAMVLGAIPLAFASGAGKEIRIPLGSVIAGGMTVGTIFTIFVVPVFYTYIAGIKKHKKCV